MRTRTLLLLAVTCGLAILLAGLFLLLRVDRSSSTVEQVAIGATTQAGDLRVTVLSSNETDGLMRVSVRVGGVVDDSLTDDFSLVVPGRRIAPLAPPQGGDTACTGVTIAETTCDLVFGTAQVEGTPRTLLLERADEKRRWNLVTG